MIRMASMRIQTRSWRTATKPLISNPVGLSLLAILYILLAFPCWLLPVHYSETAFQLFAAAVRLRNEGWCLSPPPRLEPGVNH